MKDNDNNIMQGTMCIFAAQKQRKAPNGKDLNINIEQMSNGCCALVAKGKKSGS